MRRFVVATLCLLLTSVGLSCTQDPEPIHIGAIYPLTGSQGVGGRDEYRGVSLASEFVNEEGGVDGRPIDLRAIDVSGGDAAPGAIDALADQGVQLVLGSYGSTISQPAAAEAAARGMLFWETGAVGSMAPPDGRGTTFFRVAPSGEVLGGDAMTFIASRLAPMFNRDPSTLRFAVANVDDVYGAAVARGAVREIHALGLPFAGRFPYDALDLRAGALVRRIAARKPDVLFVSAYVEDGISLRRAMVRNHLPLLANIGTSSSYCMPQFGARLGTDAVGLFASDKLDAEYVDPRGLTSSSRALFERAASTYEDRYRTEMSAAALAGFSAAWAVFHDVLPAATDLTPGAVATAALGTHVPIGGLPNGSGLLFGQPGTPAAGANLRAMSVIWEWVAPEQREVVWPPRFATAPVKAIRIQP